MIPSVTERPFSETRRKFLQARYDLGLFLPPHWVSVYLGGREERMNGNHSSNLLWKVPEPFPERLHVHLDEYEAETPEDVILLFRQFDARESSRSPNDVANAYQHTYPAIQHLNNKIAKAGIEAIVWYNRVVEGQSMVRGDDRYQLFGNRSHDAFLHWLDTVLDIKTPEMQRVEVIAAMYATDLVASGEHGSHAFWAEVARGGRPYEDTHPTTVLDKWLKACKDGTCGDKMKSAYHYQGCLYAWNAYREERSIKEIRFTTNKGLYLPHA